MSKYFAAQFAFSGIFKLVGIEFFPEIRECFRDSSAIVATIGLNEIKFPQGAFYL